jgi:hypothetical protein
MDDYDLPDDSDMEEECMSEDELTMTAPSDTRTASSDNGQPTASGSRNAPVARERSNAGPSKTKIVIRDAAYRTWFALIYYLYTDVIIFAPLSSSFIDKPDNRDTAGGSTARPAIAADNQVLKGIRGRKEWLDVWTSEMLSRNGNYQGPTPCSAKAIYRLADVSGSLERAKTGGGESEADALRSRLQCRAISNRNWISLLCVNEPFNTSFPS